MSRRIIVFAAIQDVYWSIIGWLYGVQALECLALMGVVTTLMLAATLACGLPVPKVLVTKIVIILSAITSKFRGRIIVMKLFHELPIDSCDIHI